MFRKSIVIEYCEHQRLVKSVGVGKIFELKGFIEEWVESFSMNFCFKLFHAFCLWHQEHLNWRKVWKIIIYLLFTEKSFQTARWAEKTLRIASSAIYNTVMLRNGLSAFYKRKNTFITFFYDIQNLAESWNHSETKTL